MPQSGCQHKHMQSKMCHRHEDCHSKAFCVVYFPVSQLKKNNNNNHNFQQNWQNQQKLTLSKTHFISSFNLQILQKTNRVTKFTSKATLVPVVDFPISV